LERCKCGFSNVLAFPDPETARAVIVHPNALRLFWGLQVPVTAQCGVFNLDAFIRSFREPAECRDAPFFFYLNKFNSVLRSRAFVPAVLDFILRTSCDGTALRLLGPASNADDADREAQVKALQSVTKFVDRDEALYIKQLDLAEACAVVTPVDSFIENVLVSNLGLSCLAGVRIAIAVFADSTLVVTVTATLKPVSTNTLLLPTHMALAYPEVVCAPAFQVRTVPAFSDLKHRTLANIPSPLLKSTNTSSQATNTAYQSTNTASQSTNTTRQPTSTATLPTNTTSQPTNTSS
jgi:hypothetical protein